MFNHVNNYNLPVLEVQEINGFRYYKSPNGIMLPSITTVLGSKENPSLDRWKKSIGEKEAGKISKRAIDRGHIIHELCEKYLKNEPINKNSVMPWIWAMFLTIRPFLDKLSNIHCLETTLYSEKLGIAGRVDCIADYESKTAVVDFKGSTKEKTIDHIENYCLQITAYSLMFEELTLIPIKKSFIMMAIEHEAPKLFSIKPDDYKNKLFQIINSFKTKYPV